MDFKQSSKAKKSIGKFLNILLLLQQLKSTLDCNGPVQSCSKERWALYEEVFFDFCSVYIFFQYAPIERQGNKGFPQSLCRMLFGSILPQQPTSFQQLMAPESQVSNVLMFGCTIVLFFEIYEQFCLKKCFIGDQWRFFILKFNGHYVFKVFLIFM